MDIILSTNHLGRCLQYMAVSFVQVLKGNQKWSTCAILAGSESQKDDEPNPLNLAQEDRPGLQRWIRGATGGDAAPGLSTGGDPVVEAARFCFVFEAGYRVKPKGKQFFCCTGWEGSSTESSILGSQK